MDFTSYLERDEDTLAGAVRIKGTRLSVDFILELFQSGWSEAEIFDNYPQVTRENLGAVFAFARQALNSEQIIPIAS